MPHSMHSLLLFFLTIRLIIGQNLTCPYSYTLVMYKCLKVYPQGNHSMAELNCRDNGGTLTNIRNSIENRAVSQFAAQNNLNQIWIGLFCFGNDPSSCLYDDVSGSLSTYNEFSNQNPLVKTLDDGCVYMTTTGSQAGKWISANCNSINIGTVCEVPSSAYQKPGYSGCQDFDGFRYCPMSTNTFEDAIKYCHQDNAGKLLSINSKRENDFVNKRFEKDNYFVLGAIKVFQGSYVWLDGSAWGTYDNRNLLSDNYQDNYLCMEPKTGYWRSCNKYSTSFVCKAPLPPKEVVDTSHCNSTQWIMAPVIITSIGYPYNGNTQPCTYRIATVGAYNLGVTITNIDRSTTLQFYDGDGEIIDTVDNCDNCFSGPSNIISPLNIMTVVASGGKFSAQVVAY